MPIQSRRAEAGDILAIVQLMNVAFRGTGDDAGWNSETNFIDGDRTRECGESEQWAFGKGARMIRME